MRIIKSIAFVLLFACCFLRCAAPKITAGKSRPVWTEAEANRWYQKQGWLVGSNYVPAYAINQLEMWQAETFDTARIDR